MKAALLYNLPFAACLALALALPDWIMSVVSAHDRVLYTPGILAYLVLFCLLLSFVRPLGFLLGLILLLGALETVHFLYLAYFGGVIDANVITHGLLEYEDVVKGGIGVLPYLGYVPPVVVVPYLVAWSVIKRLSGGRVVIPFMWVVILGLASWVPLQILRDGDAVRYYPNDIYPSIANSYLTFSSLLFNHLPRFVFHVDRGDRGRRFGPASVSPLPVPERQTVVVIMNESLTYRHMSLYGYERNTTPHLSAFRNDPHFVFKRGIAGGIGTLSTFYSFWNGVRDPRNEAEFMRQTTNLFRLARIHGFRTVYLSAQGSNLLRGDGAEYINELITIDMVEELYDRLHDEMLLELLRQVQFGDRNFLVVHFRTAHGPYEDNYARRPDMAIFPTEGVDYGTYQTNTYDNAVCYNDFLMAELLQRLRRTIRGPLYVFMTSDHGQLLGETDEKLFGHGMLVPQVADVPIMLYERDGDPAIIDSLRRMRQPTHFELAELIARLLGFRIIDPNAVSGRYYINGVGFYGRGGYIVVRKPAGDQGEIEYVTMPADSG